MPSPSTPTSEAIYKFLSKSVDNMLVRTDVGLERGERGRLYAWYWGYYGRAALDMHKATGEQRYLDIIRNGIRRLLDDRDDRIQVVDQKRGVVFPSWGTKYKDGSRANEITTAGLITLPMCEYAAYTGDNDVATVAIETLAAFMPERKDAGDGAYYFEHLTDEVVEALNHASVYGAALAHCSRLPGSPDIFAETALGIQTYFMRFTRQDGEALAWPYAPAPNDPPNLPSEAIWKASASIELPIALHEVGLLNDPKLLDQLAAIVTKNPILRAGGIPQFIGSDRPIPLTERFDNTSMPGALAAWLQIDNSELRETILATIERHPEKFPRGWWGGSRAMIMGLAHLLAHRAI